MSHQTETVTESPADVVRALYDALGKGDVPGVLAKPDADVIVDEPNQQHQISGVAVQIGHPVEDDVPYGGRNLHRAVASSVSTPPSASGRDGSRTKEALPAVGV